MAVINPEIHMNEVYGYYRGIKVETKQQIEEAWDGLLVPGVSPDMQARFWIGYEEPGPQEGETLFSGPHQRAKLATQEVVSRGWSVLVGGGLVLGVVYKFTWLSGRTVLLLGSVAAVASHFVFSYRCAQAERRRVVAQKELSAVRKKMVERISQHIDLVYCLANKKPLQVDYLGRLQRTGEQTGDKGNPTKYFAYVSDSLVKWVTAWDPSNEELIGKVSRLHTVIEVLKRRKIEEVD